MTRCARTPDEFGAGRARADGLDRSESSANRHFLRLSPVRGDGLPVRPERVGKHAVEHVDAAEHRLPRSSACRPHYISGRLTASFHPRNREPAHFRVPSNGQPPIAYVEADPSRPSSTAPQSPNSAPAGYEQSPMQPARSTLARPLASASTAHRRFRLFLARWKGGVHSSTHDQRRATNRCTSDRHGRHAPSVGCLSSPPPR